MICYWLHYTLSFKKSIAGFRKIRQMGAACIARLFFLLPVRSFLRSGSLVGWWSAWKVKVCIYQDSTKW